MSAFDRFVSLGLLSIVLGCRSESPVQPTDLEFPPVTPPAQPPLVPLTFPIRDVIAYTSARYGDGEVTLIAPDGTNRQHIALGQCPAVSPSGDAIAYNHAGVIVIQTSSGSATASGYGGCPVWSPDGKKLVVMVNSVDNNGNSSFAVIDRNGAEISRGFGVTGFSARWSHDGRYLALGYCVHVFHVPCTPESRVVAYDSLAVGQAYRILSPGGTSVDFSPDDKRVTWSCGGSICVAPSSGGTGQVIGAGYEPRWSPLNNTIAYTCGGFVCKIDASGGSVTQLSVRARRIEWSPDGKALVADGGMLDGELFLMNADGSNLRNVTNERGLDEFGSWGVMTPGIVTSPFSGSPVATTSTTLTDAEIAYVKFGPGPQITSTPRVRVIRDDGSQDRRLTNAEVEETCPAISPDRRFVAIVSNGIWIVSADGRVERQVADSQPPDAQLSCPAWSPDGQHLAWFNRFGQYPHSFQLWAADVSGSPLKLLAGGEEIRGVVWTSDSKSVLYEEAQIPTDPGKALLSRVDLNGVTTRLGSGNWHAAMQRADGKLVLACGAMICVTGPNGESPITLTTGARPVWSPDGSRIAFVRIDNQFNGYQSDFIMNADGSNLRQITDSDEGLAWRSWSPKGDAIAFEQRKSISIVRLDGSRSKLLTTGDPQIKPSWTYYGAPLFY